MEISRKDWDAVIEMDKSDMDFRSIERVDG